jgi:hypothetical protein
MELHTHPHHVTHKKKWTEYLLDFFMLFLAVFLGFVTENFREHAEEKERATQYIRSFYNDLLNDTAVFSLLINEYKLKAEGLEGRKECFQSLKHSDECLQNIFNNSRGFTDLITSDQTLQQLKNSGNFRLLTPEDTDSILLYDKMIRTYVKEETTNFQENQYTLRNTIFSLHNYKQTLEQNGIQNRLFYFLKTKSC